MGNTVSAAEIAATQIIHPQSQKVSHTSKSNYSGQEYPPECPMHQKQTHISECPVNHDGINPLNMVYYINF